MTCTSHWPHCGHQIKVAKMGWASSTRGVGKKYRKYFDVETEEKRQLGDLGIDGIR